MNVTEGDFLREALEFLVEAMENFDQKKWKFSVLHASMAVEMVLKERLVKVHPAAISENVDNPDCPTTVGMKKILPRLQSFGIKVVESDQLLVGQIAGWRNDVAHRKLDAKQEDVARKLKSIYKFFSQFLAAELGIQVKDVLSDSVYHTYKAHLKEWDEVVREAQEAAKVEGDGGEGMPYNTFDCPECWGVAETVVLRDGGKAHCFLCNGDFPYVGCSRCENIIFRPQVIAGAEEGGNYCESCLGHIFGQPD